MFVAGSKRYQAVRDLKLQVCGSPDCVVASVRSMLSLNGTAPTTDADSKASFGGGAAAAPGARTRASAANVSRSAVRK